jgi:hypothetical protein
VDENGVVTMKEDGHDDTKDTAMSHSTSTLVNSPMLTVLLLTSLRP